MSGDADLARVAREAADSVFAFLERTAEPVEDGVRWETLDWHNRPHYTPVIFTGMGGIAFFLADYAPLAGSARALALAEGALRWCASPARESERDPEWEWAGNGLMRGRSGLGLAWLSLARAQAAAGSAAGGSGRAPAQATGGAEDSLRQAAVLADQVMAAGPGPVTDWQDGAAGELLFLLRLGEATGESRYVEGAARWAAWLEEVAVHDGDGAYWPWQTDHDEYAKWFGLSFVPGSAGIAHVLLSLYARTRDERWAALARAAGETLLRQAVSDRGGLNWPDTLDGLAHGERLRCQWCDGASGVGLLFARAHETLGSAERPYLQTALAAGEATYAYGDVRRNPCLCHGLAGSTELLLELHRLSGDALWHTRAAEFARMMLSYRTRSPEGDVWQSDDPGFSSPDFLYGVSGTGHTFLRLWHPQDVAPPLL